MKTAFLHHDDIYRGETFYREVVLECSVDPSIPYDEVTNSRLVTSADGIPVSALMTAKGAKVADFPCAWLDSTDTLPERVAWTMPKATTAGLSSVENYIYSLNTDSADGITSTRRMYGQIRVAL